MDIQRLRTLTTGRLHTKIEYLYEDLEMLIGEKGLMTHMLPRAMMAVKPWLEDNVTDERFWDGEYDPSHIGDYPLPTPTKEDQTVFFERFAAQPNPLAGKNVIGVVV